MRRLKQKHSKLREIFKALSMMGRVKNLFDPDIIVILLIAELIATDFAMRSKQKRFVYNVIAMDIHVPEKKQE